MSFLRGAVFLFALLSGEAHTHFITLNKVLTQPMHLNALFKEGVVYSLSYFNHLFSFFHHSFQQKIISLESSLHQNSALFYLRKEKMDLKEALLFVMGEIYLFIGLFFFVFVAAIYFAFRFYRQAGRRKEAELRLASQLKFHQDVIEAMPYPIAIKDQHHVYQTVNLAFEKLVGKTKSQLIGRFISEGWERIKIDQSDLICQLNQACLLDHQSKQVELSFEDLSGKKRYGLFGVTPCVTTDENQKSLVTTFVDVTEIRLAEQRSRKIEERLLDVTKSLPVIVFQLKRDALGMYSLAYVGGEVDHWLKAEQMRYIEDIFSFVEPDDRLNLKKNIEHSALFVQRFDIEFRINVGDHCRWIHGTFVPKKENIHEVVWSGFFSEITLEKQKSEELARARDLAEAALKAKDSFLAMMSHEIRTPMSGALGLLEVLEKTPMNTEQKRMLNMIHDSADTLLRILDDILDFSKIQAGHLTINEKEMDIRQVVDQSISLLLSRAYEKGLKIYLDIDFSVAAILLGDGIRVHQVLFNLLSNAIKFTLSGEVFVRIFAQNLNQTQQSITIQVQDTGIGIPKEVQVRLFDPFVRIQNEQTPQTQGTGLGLTICKKIVDLMKGSISLRSQEGKGTTFTVNLCFDVIAHHYTTLPLLAKSIMIIVQNTEVAQSLKNFAQALGMFSYIVHPVEHHFVFGHAEKFDAVFIDEQFQDLLKTLSHPVMIELTENLKIPSFQVTKDKIFFSVNPISWRSLQELCMQILIKHEKNDEILLASPVEVSCRQKAIEANRLILVAEDYPVSQMLIRYQLNLLGLACDIVEDGFAAYEAWKKNDYALLITDCHMPQLPGYKLAKKIRDDEREKHLPIIGITASTTSEDHELFKQHGVEHILIKPIQLSVLAEAIKTWIPINVEVGSTFSLYSIELPVDQTMVEQTLIDELEKQWGTAVAKDVLGAFTQEMRNDVAVLECILLDETLDISKLRAWCHRALGASMVVKYQSMTDVIKDFQAQLSQPDIQQNQLLKHANQFLNTISQQLKNIEKTYRLFKERHHLD